MPQSEKPELITLTKGDEKYTTSSPTEATNLAGQGWTREPAKGKAAAKPSAPAQAADKK